MTEGQATTPAQAIIRWRLLAFVLILTGFAMRLYHLDAQALTGDEAFTVLNWTRQPLSTVFSSIALIDPQPPVVLLTVIGWARVAGDSVFALRFLPALASTVTLAAVYGIGRKLGGDRVATIALTLATINPFQIWYAQDNRAYGLWMAVSAVTAWYFLLATDRPSKRSHWIGYILTATLGLYIYYLEAFLIIAQNLYMLTQVRRRKNLLKPWIISQTIIALLIAPWYLQPSLRNSGYRPTAGPVNLPIIFEKLLFGETLPGKLSQPLFTLGSNSFTVPAIIAIIIVAAALIVLIRARRQQPALFLGLYTLIPTFLLAMLTIVTQKGYFRTRYVAASSTAIILLAALLIEYLNRENTTRRSLALLTGLIIFTVSGSSLWAYHFGPSKAPRWPELTAALAQDTGPDDLILRNYPDPAFDYYYDGTTEQAMLPATQDFDAEDTYQTLEKLLGDYQRIWFMPVPSPDYDKDQIVADWLLSHAQLVTDGEIAGTHVMIFSTWQVDPANIENTTNIPYGEVVVLRGYNIIPSVDYWQPGRDIILETFWEPQQTTSVDLKLFVHLLGPTNVDGSPLWGQDDHLPQNGQLSSQTWETNMLFRDASHVTIPADAPAGDYAVTVGLYDPATGERIPINTLTPQAEENGATLITFSLP